MKPQHHEQELRVHEAFEGGDQETGLRILAELVASDPLDADLRTLRGGYLLEVGALDAPHTECVEAIRLAPSSEEAHVELAHVYRGTSRLEEACGVLKSYLTLNPEGVNALLVLANTQVELGRPSEALTTFEGLQLGDATWRRSTPGVHSDLASPGIGAA